MPAQRFALKFLVLLPLIIVPLGAQKNPEEGDKKLITATAKYFYKFPPRIQKVLTDSIVGVEVSFLAVEAGVMKPTIKSATGFVVGNNTVLTSLHTFSDFLAVWSKALVRVYDGQNFFEATMVGASPSADLALLVVAKTENGVGFLKKPVKFADYADKKKIPDRFYTFALSIDGKNVYFPMELGKYLMETNLLGGELFPEPFGIVGGNAERGFSGAPLIGSDGKVYGLLNRRREDAPYAYVSTLEQIGSFLKESAKKFNEEAAWAPGSSERK